MESLLGLHGDEVFDIAARAKDKRAS
jgi:hypothetical protein